MITAKANSFCSPQAEWLMLFALPKKYAKTLGKIMLLPSCHHTPAILPGQRSYGFKRRCQAIYGEELSMLLGVNQLES
jgi:hypothetical protein